MSQPYVGECRLVGFNFAPVNWAICQGQQIAISTNETLFNLIGTTYGGDGQTNFLLPDLRGRAPIHQGNGMVIGQPGGTETVTVTGPQLPIHNHPLLGTPNNGTSNNFNGNALSQCPTRVYMTGKTPDKTMNAKSVTNSDGSLPHNNLQPFLTMNWIISLFGIYPTPS